MKFYAYHPYLTYSNGAYIFLDAKGKSSIDGWHSVSDADTIALWRLGKEAYSSLSTVESKAAFDQSYEEHLKGISLLRRMIKLASEEKGLVFTHETGDAITPDFDDLPATEVLSVAWQITRKNAEVCGFLKHHFLFACLEQIDHAIVGLCLDGGAVSAALSAADAYANFQAIESGNESLQQARSELAARAAIERYRRDPKQQAKILVKGCWQEWKAEPDRYRSQMSFATDMMDKVQTDANGNPIISPETIVKKWIPEWTKENK